MRKTASILMISILTMSTVLPGVVHANENIIADEQVIDNNIDNGTEKDEETAREISSENKAEKPSDLEEETENEAPEEAASVSSITENVEEDNLQTRANNEEVTVTFINGSSLYKQTQVIINNTVAYPGAPELTEGQSNFLGWYTEVDGGTQFDFNTPVTNSLTLYARFSNSYLIQFKDQAGKVIDSKEVEQGQNIPETNVELTPPQGEYFSYWYVEGDDTQTPFSFETATASKDIVLVPKFASERTVLFISEGSQIDPAYIKDGEKVSQPVDPTREGWTFSHWATEQNGSTAYNFDSPVTDSLVLYAVWSPEETEYTVVFWKEKPNIAEDPGTDPSNYAFAWSTKQTGQSGENINIDENTAEDIVNGNSQATDALSLSEYAFSKEQIISGNGQTIVNVYYKRTVYELEFNLYINGVSQIEMEVDGVTYRSSDSSKYTINAKDGQYIADKWPGDAKIVSENPYDSKFNGWKVPSDSPVYIQWTKPSVFYFNSNFVSITPGKKTLTLTASFAIDLEEYTTQNFLETFEESDEQIDGFFFKASDPTTYYSYGAFDPDKRTPPGYSYYYRDDSENYYKKFYFIRKIYNLNFDTQGGIFTDDGQTTEKKYEEKIEEPNDPTREGYKFAGWYLDADYHEKMNFDTFTMPDSDVMLFAKWESTQNTVRYFDGFGGKQLLEQGYSDSEDFVFPRDYVKGETYVEGKGIFNGWFWQVGASSFEFSDTIPITKDIDLYAKWQTTGYELTYDLGEGTGTTPEDSNKYDMVTQAKLQSCDGITPPQRQVFVGWRSNRDNHIYYPNTHMQVKGDTQLTAVYASAEDTVKINYHPGNYEGNPATIQQDALKGSTVKLQEMIFTRPDKTLVGWSKTENGEKDYELGEDNFNVSTTDIDLYAMWEDKYINVTFLPGNNGSLDYKGKDITNAILYNTKWLDAELDTPEPQPDTGFKFAGWSPEFPKESEKLTADKTFVAQFVELASGKVTVRYLDDNGEAIAEDKVLSGTESEDYDVSGEEYRLESIGDYKLIDETNNSKGIFNEDNILVIYTYQRESIANTGQIKVSYVDENGKKISDDVVKSGTIGDTYTTEQKEIEGYTFKEVHGNSSGAFMEETQLITYVYTKNSDDKPVEETEDDYTNGDSDSSSGDKTEDKEPVNNNKTNGNNATYQDKSISSVTSDSVRANDTSNENSDQNKNNQLLPSTGEKTVAVAIMLGIMLLITSSLVSLLKRNKGK